MVTTEHGKGLAKSSVDVVLDHHSIYQCFSDATSNTVYVIYC